jgi:hypothetical protein
MIHSLPVDEFVIGIVTDFETWDFFVLSSFDSPQQGQFGSCEIIPPYLEIIMHKGTGTCFLTSHPLSGLQLDFDQESGELSLDPALLKLVELLFFFCLEERTYYSTCPTRISTKKLLVGNRDPSYNRDFDMNKLSK